MAYIAGAGRPRTGIRGPLKMPAVYHYVHKKRNKTGIFTWQSRSKVEILYQGHFGKTHQFCCTSPRKAVVAWGVDVFHAMAFSSLGKVNADHHGMLVSHAIRSLPLLVPVPCSAPS